MHKIMFSYKNHNAINSLMNGFALKFYGIWSKTWRRLRLRDDKMLKTENCV